MLFLVFICQLDLVWEFIVQLDFILLGQGIPGDGLEGQLYVYGLFCTSLKVGNL